MDLQLDREFGSEVTLRTRLAALVADAERYQWLRLNYEPEMHPTANCAEYDAAIDAAIVTQQTKESQ